MTSAAAEVTEHMEKMGECNGACVCVCVSFLSNEKKKKRAGRKALHAEQENATRRFCLK